MKVDRRGFIKAGAALACAAALPRPVWAQSAFISGPGAWRTFETVTRIEILKPEGKVQAWMPIPSVNAPEWFKPLDNKWTANAQAAGLKRDPHYGAEMVHFEWRAGEAAPAAEIASRFATRDRAIGLANPGNAAPLSDSERRLYTGPADLIPIDGIVKQTADKITAGAKTELEKAKAIYDWIVENSARNPQTRGCGIGDIGAMLKAENLSGKCADINALFVGLARASGLPARDVYGIRVAPSRFGYKSLGANSEIVTKAQHCRAEVYLTGYGWAPADPADVRKVVLEEPPGNLALADSKAAGARQTLFGAWEGNWLAYNFAHDVALPGGKGPALGFLMYPQAETAAGQLDCLDPENFKYTIKAKEILS